MVGIAASRQMRRRDMSRDSHGDIREDRALNREAMKVTVPFSPVFFRAETTSDHEDGASTPVQAMNAA
jgi:hypothetical protein